MHKIICPLLLLSFACRPETQLIEAHDPRQTTLFDADNDGDLDLLFVDSPSGAEGLFLSRQDARSFSAPTSLVSAQITQSLLADLAGDGTKELLFASPELGLSRLVPSLDVPQLEPLRVVVGADLVQFAVGDASRDGLPDLLLLRKVGSQQALELHTQQADGAFLLATSTALSDKIRSLVAADLDNDGATDLVGATDTELLLLRSDGAGNFSVQQLPAPSSFSSLKVADLSGDGAPDILLLDESLVAPSSVLLRNDGAGLFTKKELTANGLPLLNAALVDINGDGALDIAFQDCRAGLIEGVVPHRRLLFSLNEQSTIKFDDKLPIPDRYLTDLQLIDVNGDGLLEVIYTNPALQIVIQGQ